jgi:hypothetical protein
MTLAQGLQLAAGHLGKVTENRMAGSLWWFLEEFHAYDGMIFVCEHATIA